MWIKQKGTKMTEIQQKEMTEKIPGQLGTYIDRIERLEEEKKELLADIREIYSEAKGAGFDTKVMRQVIKLRKMDPADRAENQFLLQEYKKLLGINE